MSETTVTWPFVRKQAVIGQNDTVIRRHDTRISHPDIRIGQGDTVIRHSDTGGVVADSAEEATP